MFRPAPAAGTPEEEVRAAVVAQCVVPGASLEAGDSRLELPPANRVRAWSEPDTPLRFLAFPSSTTTRSGYDVKRKNFLAYVVADGRRPGQADVGRRLYVLCASARSDQINADKEALLLRIVQSLNVL